MGLGSGTMAKFSIWWSSCCLKMIKLTKMKCSPDYCQCSVGQRSLLAHYSPPFHICSNYFFAFIFFSTSSLSPTPGLVCFTAHYITNSTQNIPFSHYLFFRESKHKHHAGPLFTSIFLTQTTAATTRKRSWCIRLICVHA